MRNIIRTLVFATLFTCVSGISFFEPASTIKAASVRTSDWVFSRDNSVITGGSSTYLINLNDPSGKSRIIMDDILRSIDGPGDQKKYKNYNASIEELSSDGTKMLVIRERKDAYSNGILVGKRHFIFQIYNLAAGKREAEFKRNGDYGLDILFTSDLNAYIYESNSQLHIVNVHTGAERIQNNRNYIKNIYNGDVLAGSFSEDGNKRVYTGKTKGIIVTDFSNNPAVERLLPNTKGIGTIHWFDGKQILCDLSDHNLYLINIKDETQKRVYHYPDDFTNVIASTAVNQVILRNSDLNEASILDVKTGKERDISQLFHKGQNWIIPTQWIKSTIDYTRYIKH